MADYSNFDRTTGLGSTDVAAIAGIHPYLTAHDIYLLKTKQTPPPEMNEAMSWGLKMEDPIAAEFSYRHDETLQRPYPPVVVHPDHDWAFCSPDFHVVTGWTEGTEAGGKAFYDRIVEVKTAGLFSNSSHTRKRWENGGLPAEYRAQCVWQAFCHAGRVKRVDVAAFVSGLGYEERTLDMAEHKGMADALFETAHKFWHENVLKGVPPPVNGSEACTRSVFEQHPAPKNDTVRNATAVEDQLLTQLQTIKDSISQLADQKRTLENRLRLSIGDDLGVDSKHARVLWKTPEQGRVAWKQLAQFVGYTEVQIKTHTSKPKRGFYITWR